MCAIYGTNDADIADTATFFWSLQHLGEDASLVTGGYTSYCDKGDFDVTALLPQQLARILDANPTRSFGFCWGKWTPEQSVILATRPHPLRWEFVSAGFGFEDAFGSLCISYYYRDETIFVDANLQRLFQLDGIF